MFNKLEQIVEKYEELSKKLGGGEVDFKSKEYSQLAKEHRLLEKTVKVYDQFKAIDKQLKETQGLLNDSKDEELRILAQEEQDDLKAQYDRLLSDLKISLFPKDPNSDKNIIMEIRAGTGGNEAGLFAADLYRMYLRYAEKCKWKIEVLSSSLTEVGGYKEIIFSVAGEGVYDKLKHEMGGHRVQRIPATESGGRIHTSAVTVAVLAEAEETEVNIQPSDLRIDVYRSSGPGGQSVNTTDSAVRITHISSGIMVQCQDEKSQHKNKAKAMRVLRARLQEKLQSEQQKEMAEIRKQQIGSGDRSERIRTYNFPQNRITDHRINLTAYNKLENMLNGELDEFINALMESAKKHLLENISNV
ncbi:MAG: peptide chain release factor 1 [bacterium]|nr:MAG: peptide chain release factor 1 [bacterium]